MVISSLIFTFDIHANRGISERLERIKAFYIHSIQTAKSLGYTTEIYTNCNWFDTIVDIVHPVTDSFFFWDGFKTIPLLRTDNYLLVDGDITFKRPFNTLDSTVDIYFDTYESWYEDYSKTVSELSALGIKNIIPEWEDTPKPVINIGVLRINNPELKRLYLKRWIDFQDFCIANKDSINRIHHCCTIGSQYILTLLSKDYTKHWFSQKVKVPNEFYLHHWGEDKYFKPLPKFHSTVI